MIGTSVSSCIKDIIEGRVNVNDVTKIISGTNVPDPLTWIRVSAAYCDTYWKTNPSEALLVLYYLLSEGKIDQPRTRGEMPPWGTKVWWDTFDEFYAHQQGG
jgi:hypothetical protein